MATPVWRNLQQQLHRISLLSSNNTASKSKSWIPVIRGCLSNTPQMRMASEARKMAIAPSQFNWTRFKNDIHFYFLLGALPLGTIILYANFFIGESELVDIPEGYEPKEWEYQKHPIHRWFVKYVYDSEVKQYEMEACKSIHTFEAARNNARISRVKEMMKRDDDYRAYYFIPAVDRRGTDKVGKQHAHDLHNERGSG